MAQLAASGEQSVRNRAASHPRSHDRAQNPGVPIAATYSYGHPTQPPASPFGPSASPHAGPPTIALPPPAAPPFGLSAPSDMPAQEPPPPHMCGGGGSWAGMSDGADRPNGGAAGGGRAMVGGPACGLAEGPNGDAGGWVGWPYEYVAAMGTPGF